MDPEGQGRPGLSPPTARPPRAAPPPLLVRVGARFACSGDGLCCTDLHALGPVSRKETKRLRVIQPGSVIKHQSLKIHMIDTVSHPGGGEGCTFLRPHGCGIYSERPHTCHHFPYNLTSTPLGLRVSTDHRCPCRTLGPRPALDPEAARSSLSDALGRLLPDVRVGATIPLRPRYNIAFARYQDEVENPLLRALLDGDDPLAALATAPFAPLKSSSWGDVAHLLRGYADGTTGGEAVALFGDVLLTLQGQNTRAKRNRKWAWAFDNAEARGVEP